MSETKLIGALGEEAARNLYARHGFKILAKNFYNSRGRRRGEIDFIAEKNKHLHFVEVKARTSSRFGAAEESITGIKRKRLLISVRFFLAYFGQYADYGLHIDVASVQITFDKRVERVKITSDAIEGIY